MKNLTLEEFTLELQSHDWHYEMASGRAYYAGRDNEQKLKSLCNGNPEFKTLFDTIRERVQKAHRGR